MNRIIIPKGSAAMRRWIAVGIGLLIVPVVFFTLWVDQWCGLTVDPRYNLTMIAIGGVIGMSSAFISRRLLYLMIPTFIMLLLLFLSVVDLSPVKPAVRAVNAIQPGMTEPQVRALFNAAFPPNGRFHQPAMGPLKNNILNFPLDPTDGRYNAAFVRIQFDQGRCIAATFSPD